ncbi:MAG TPA: serine/threonine-protein kinase [Thermoanaerobaculaceae bacterium]|nr:serine/threonine-protein kinase [Thermoanaerobaculaceae bacterium]
MGGGEETPNPTLAVTVGAAVERPVERRIGAYRVLGELGHGGMGTVFLAARADDQYQKLVAIKTIRGIDGGGEALRHFRRERQILADLDHPNIARLLDGGTTDDGLPYLVMERVEGEPIDRYCDERKLSVRERLRLFLGVCAAVQFAHQNLVVHRDLKPSNILVDAQGVPKLLDFGIAKLIEPEAAGGTATLTSLAMTPQYASPEQVRGQAITTATDVYSLGVVLYELLTGHRPYGRAAPTSLEFLKAVCEEEAERPSAAVLRAERRTLAGGEVATATPESVSRTREGTPDRLRRQLRGELDTIVLTALRKEPQRRYRSVEALAEDVLRHLEGRPVAAHKATIPYRARKFVRRNALAVGSAAVLFFLAIGFSIAATVQARRVARERDRANREAVTSQRVSDFLVNLFKISDPDESRGNSVTARELLDRSVREIEGGLQEEPAVKGTLLYTMGLVYDDLGLSRQALALAEEALAHLRETPRRDEAAIAAALVEVANIRCHLGQYQAAEPTFREALAIQERLYGPEHADVARTLDDLGLLYQDVAEFDRAEPLHRRALAMLERTTGPRSRDVATVLTNLANLASRRGRYGDAEALQRRALGIQEELLGPDHPEVCSELNNLATTEFYLENYDQAEALFRRVLALYGKTEGADHPDVGIALNNLGNVAQVRGEFRTAEDSFLRAVAIFAKAGEPEHPTALAALGNLATVYRDTGRYEEAASLQRRALEADRRALGPDHPSVAFDQHRLAVILSESGRTAEAEPLELHAVAVVERALGPDHPDLAALLMEVGDICRAGGKREEAERTYTRALGISMRALGPDSRDVADLRLRLASLAQESGGGPAAAALLAAALDACAKRAAGSHPTPVELARHATALLLLGRTADARPLAEEAFGAGYRRRPFVALCASHRILPAAGRGP